MVYGLPNKRLRKGLVWRMSKNGPDENARILIDAIRDRDTRRISAMLASPASINLQYRESRTELTPFLRSCKEGDFSTARQLLSIRPGLGRAVDKFGYNCLHLAAIGGEDGRFVDLLAVKRRGARVLDLNALTKHGDSALIIASRHGNTLFASFISSLLYKDIRIREAETIDVEN